MIRRLIIFGIGTVLRRQPRHPDTSLRMNDYLL